MAGFDKLEGFRRNEPNVAYIGEGVSFKGEIAVPDVIVVDGVVEGDLTAHSVRVGPSGAIRGNIIATDADVHGIVAEKLEVKQLLIVRATGRIEGTVSYGELQIEKGAVISGGFSCTDFRSEKKPVKADAVQAKTEKLKITYNRAQSERDSEPARTHLSALEFGRVAQS